MSKVKRLVSSFLGQVYLPESVRDRDENIVLHLSDTPSVFYASLESLLKKAAPEHIVHTGDVVDDIKLELYPHQWELYEKKAARLLDILESSGALDIHIALGNHDSIDLLQKHAGRSRIFTTRSLLIEQKRFNVSHYSESPFQDPAQYHLFGHDLSRPSGFDKGRWHLNGISALHVIFLESGKIIPLGYPLGVDEARLGKNRIGL